MLIFPFIKDGSGYLFAIFKREDMDIWQGIAGGGEDNETPEEAMKRELFEETGIGPGTKSVRLASMTTIPAENIHGLIWGNDLIMIPEFAFGVEVADKYLKISNEHLEYCWVDATEAIKRLKYDSNKSAVWELSHRLKQGDVSGIEKNKEVIKQFL